MYRFLRKLNQPLHPSWSFYAGVVGVLCGIVISYNYDLVLTNHILWLVVAGLALLITIFHSTLLFLSLAFLAGTICANYRVSSELLSQHQFMSLVDQVVTLTGAIAEDPDTSGGKTTIRLHRIYLGEGLGNDPPLAGTVYVQLSGKAPDLLRSDQVTVRGKLGSGFGTFVATMFRPELIAVARAGPGDIFARLKNWFAAQVHDFVPSPAVDLGLGYLMGIKSGLSESLTEALRVVGMTHVIVASGTHLGILVSAAKRLFGKISKFAGLLGALILIGTFVMIVGFTPSMTRAALVASLSLGVGYVGRKFTPLRLILLVAATTLLISPINFLNLGWQLSFASFFGTLIVAPRLQRTLYGGKKPPWLAAMLITSISTTLICAPILIYNFGSLSLLALVANLIILPTLPYAMLLVLLTGIVSFSPIIATLIAWLATKLLEFHILVVNFLSEKQMFVFEFASADLRVYIIYLPILVFLLWPSFWCLRSQLRVLHSRQKRRNML